MDPLMITRNTKLYLKHCDREGVQPTLPGMIIASGLTYGEWCNPDNRDAADAIQHAILALGDVLYQRLQISAQGLVHVAKIMGDMLSRLASHSDRGISGMTLDQQLAYYRDTIRACQVDYFEYLQDLGYVDAAAQPPIKEGIPLTEPTQ